MLVHQHLGAGLGGWRTSEFQAILGYIGRPCLKRREIVTGLMLQSTCMCIIKIHSCLQSKGEFAAKSDCVNVKISDLAMFDWCSFES
jgi:hypothetical protein